MKYKVSIINNGDFNESEKYLTPFIENDEPYIFQNIESDAIHSKLKQSDLILIDEDQITKPLNEVIQDIKKSDENIITPIGVISTHPSKHHRNYVLELESIFYIRKPVDRMMLYYTIKNILRLASINKKISPLSGLPGNNQIQADMEKRLEKGDTFAVIYLDLDNFKAYNDVYGFTSGDEIIKFTANVIQNVANNYCENVNPFVGHIGGDDYVLIVDKCDYKKLSKKIIQQFDEGVTKYFSETDLKNGYLTVANRRGIIEEFPLTSISIGVVEANSKRFHNTLEIGEVGAQVKKKAKQIQGSCYVIDRRFNTTKLIHTKGLAKELAIQNEDSISNVEKISIHDEEKSKNEYEQESELEPELYYEEPDNLRKRHVNYTLNRLNKLIEANK